MNPYFLVTSEMMKSNSVLLLSGIIVLCHSQVQSLVVTLLVFSRDRSFQPRHRDDDRTLRVCTAKDHVEHCYSSFCNSTYFMRPFHFLLFSNTHFTIKNC